MSKIRELAPKWSLQCLTTMNETSNNYAYPLEIIFNLQAGYDTIK